MNPSITNRGWKTFLSWDKAAAALLILLGAVLRVRQYLTGRSLWADEAMLALNIVERGFAGMFQPLDYDQGAPIGFLLVEKLFNAVLGRHEFALRLFPVLVGLLALGLFYLLLRRVTSRVGLLVALALFVFNPRLIYYSSEVKQYIVDVAVAILLLLIAAPVLKGSPQRKDYAWLTVAGLVALWFSHPVLFVLAGIGLALLIIHLRQRDYSNIRLVLGMGILWLLEIALLYWLILKDLSQNSYMKEYWQGAFLPVPPWSDPGWFIKSLNENIGIQFGIPYAVFLVFFLMLVGWSLMSLRGAFAATKQHLHDLLSKSHLVQVSPLSQRYALIFACILLFTLTASALQLYPVFERMILFLVPIGLISIGKAIEVIYVRLQRHELPAPLLVSLLAGYLLYGPAVISLQNFIAPKYFEHIRPTMETLRDSWKDGDAMYVSYGALPAFRFYVPFYGLETISYASGEREDYEATQNIVSEIALLDGQPRVWVLLSHVYEIEGFNERDFILSYLNEIGERKREFRVPGTSVFLYLYDLGN